RFFRPVDFVMSKAYQAAQEGRYPKFYDPKPSLIPQPRDVIARLPGRRSAAALGVGVTALAAYLEDSVGGGLSITDEGETNVVLANTWFTGNKAGYGGAIYIGAGNVEIHNSYFEHNEAVGITMKALRNPSTSWAYGGAVYKDKGTLQIDSSVFK